jgi:tetratricopeptide (TPR) repeat protein
MMSVVPVKQHDEIVRMERKLSAAMGSVPRDPVAAIAALEEAISFARSSAEAAEWFDQAELLGELADEYEAAGRVDEALAAMRSAIDAGWSGHPDGRCRVAEILMRAGRAREAERIWAELKSELPDDQWLCHSAAVEYDAIGDPETALRWCTDGLRLAMRTDDPYELAEPLFDLRTRSLDKLGLPGDELQDRAENFVHSSGRAAPPALLGPAAAPVSPAGTSSRSPRIGEVRHTWFPAAEYARALRLWPELTEEGSPAARGCDHATYSRRVQRRLLEAAGELMIGMAVAPIHIDEYLSWCQREGEDPASGSARAAYAGKLPADQVVAWPPGRNDACWCGSGRKYKRCCGQPGV